MLPDSVMSKTGKLTILIVDDERPSRNAMARWLERRGYNVETAESGGAALEVLNSAVDVVISDLRMTPMDGITLLEKIKQQRPDLPVFLITAYGDVQRAVEAIKLGAEDFLTKPVDPENLLHRLEQLTLRMVGQEAEVPISPGAAGVRRAIVGRSQVLDDCLARVAAVAKAACTVLITGESGTGKELVARAIHQNSPRQRGPFIAFSAAELPETLVESELFGHKKGAFTGADRDFPGKFRAAHGGTLFFDEIGEMTPQVQAKILRVLETREVQSLGDTRPQAVDVRILFATHRDLKVEMLSGRFREDLFYRINVAHIHLPPLRDRVGDVSLLVDQFLADLAAQYQRPIPVLSADARESLENYRWPGNVRELKNVLESVFVMLTRDVISRSDLPVSLREGDQVAERTGIQGGARTMREIEQEAIVQTLRESGGNRTRAAEILGLSVRTLQRKIKEYDLPL